MSIAQEIYRTHRLALMRSGRATTGEPDPECPDVDDRGYTDPYRGPAAGVAKGRTVKVRLLRKKIEDAASLFVTSSDSNIVAVADPSDGALPNGAEMDIKLTGVDGGSDKREAKVQVRFGSKTGVIIHELTVWVFRELEVDVTPHRITINGGGGAGAAPAANVADIMKKVGDVWVHYGIKFTVHPSKDRTLTFATANVVSDSPFPGELATLLNTDWVPNTINVYFVRQIGTGSTLGYGFSRASFGGFGIPNPGIVLGDQTGTGTTRGYVMFWANDLAHEIGHFFTLWHPEQKQPPEEREDSWSRRMLMHNFNHMRRHDPWPANQSPGHPYKFRPRFDDAGYGTGRRGCFVTIKDLSQLSGDNECNTARGTITSSAGPY